jgi:rubrerythrin
MTLTLFRCKVCGEPYLGMRPPTNCPFCGASAKYILKAEKFKEPKVKMTQEMATDLVKAIQLEIDNTEFYKCAAALKESEPIASQLFRVLSKQESEHVSAIQRILKLPNLPSAVNPGFCHLTLDKNYEDAHMRESRAIRFYSEAASRATDPWVKELFTALVEIESEHLKLSEAKPQ